LSKQDSEGAPGVVLVNQAFAKKFFPEGSAIGKRLANDSDAPKWLEIVGVVGDVRQVSQTEEPRPEIYFPSAQLPWTSMSVVARTQGEPHAIAGALRKEIAAIGPGEAAYSVRSMEEVLASVLAARRFTLLLLLLFAAVALVLAVVGIYGVMAFSVAQRTNEIGVRMALGAQPGNVVRLVVGGGMRLALLGVGIGGLLAFGLMRATASMLYQAPMVDFPTLGSVALVLTAAAFTACYVPARRATRVDPQIAIRAE
jgi:putative ABC transport system permease protein